MSIVEEWARRRARSWWLVGFLGLACLLPMRAHGAEAPALLADLHDGAGLDWGSGPDRFLAVGAHTFFTARTSGTGRELWRTDGTAEGTRIVKDVRPGRLGSAPDELVALGELLLFTADDGETGRELWRSDGTPAGTWRVADLRPGPEGSGPTNLVVMDGVAYFSAADDGFDRELWRSDGTEEGTWRVRDIAPGPGARSDPFWLCAVDGVLVFAATDGAGDRELWVSDGTEEGTERVDVWPGPLSSSPSSFARVGSYAVFQASVDGVRPVWRIDPATRVVERLAEAPTVDASKPFVASGDRVFVSSGQGLWSTDGSDFRYVNPIPSVSEVATVGGWTLFRGLEAGWLRDRELWRIGGSPGVSELVADLFPGPLSSDPRGFLPVGSEVLFLASPAQGATDLFRSDGTPAGTALVDALPIGGDPRSLTPSAHSIVFVAGGEVSGRELWSTQGLPGTTGPLLDIDTANGDADPGSFQLAGGRVFFLASDSTDVVRRWRSDGTVGGTALFESGPWPWFGAESLLTTLGSKIVVFLGDRAWTLSPADTAPMLLAELDGSTVQEARDPVPTHSPQPPFSGDGPVRPAAIEWQGFLWFFTDSYAATALWRSDGTTPGTEPVYETTDWLLPWPGIGSALGADGTVLLIAGDRLFFVGGDGEPWTSDGTAEGTRQVRDIDPGPPPSEPRHATVVGSRLFFSASDPGEGRELWMSDGSEGGTVRVAAIRPGPAGAEPSPLAALGERVLFGADDGQAGREPWVSDGTEEGTAILELRPGEEGSDPRELVAFGGYVFFSADDGTHGRELWKTDGTPEGTALVRDIVPGPPGSHVRELATWGDRLVFTACDDESGCEPWTSDGTEEGTQRLADLVPGPLGSDPGDFASDGVRLVFAASSEAAGREVWWVPEPGAGAAGAVALAALAWLLRGARRR